MRRFEIQLRPFGNHLSRVNPGMTEVIMAFDVVKIGGFFNARYLIELFHVAIKAWIISNTLLITFKVTHVYRVKANQGGKQAPICFSDPITRQITILC